MTFRIVVFKGKAIKPYLRALSQMRVSEFYNFPYLYVGNVEEDYVFTKGYCLSDQGMLVIAFHADQIAGMCSGMPTSTPGSFLRGWWNTLTENKIDTLTSYYLGELIIAPEFRKVQLAGQLMECFIKEVEKMGFQSIIGVTSMREDNHPLRPKNYFDTDTVWGKYHFQKQGFSFLTPYNTRQPDGSVQENENKLKCWIRTYDPILQSI